MEVRFANNRLRRCYEDGKRATQVWGADVARRYVERVGILFIATEMEDLTKIKSLRFHPLIGNRAGEVAITLYGGWRLILDDVSDQSVRVKEVTNHYGD